MYDNQLFIISKSKKPNVCSYQLLKCGYLVLNIVVNWMSLGVDCWHRQLINNSSSDGMIQKWMVSCRSFLLSHLSGSPACGGVYSWHLSPVCWACHRTGRVLPASTLCSDTASERRAPQGPSTVTLPSPGWTGDSGDTPLPSSGLRDCPQAGGPPRDFQAAGRACPLGSRELCGTPPDWRWSPPSPDCLGNIQTHAGGNLIGEEEDTGGGYWTRFLMH